MNKLDLNAYGVESMQRDEMSKVQGGTEICVYLLLMLAAFAYTYGSAYLKNK